MDNEDRYSSVSPVGVDRGAPPDQGPVAATTSSAAHTASSANLGPMITANELDHVIIILCLTLEGGAPYPGPLLPQVVSAALRESG
jgi:hypothetical protein